MVGDCGDEAASFDAALALDGIETNEVEGDVFQDGKIVSGVAGTGAHLIIGEDDIHAPMQAIFNCPV